jgi:SAM-dependent methyltransferase
MSAPTPAATDEMTSYWDGGFLAAEARPGAFYDLKKLPAITQASHYRRMALLDALPLGDLHDKVCVDYGVGPWGFACIYPRLHDCREAIGIDLSPEAVRISAEVSRKGQFAYGTRVRYLTSTGSAVDLDDHSVDVFFAGESIEHVFNVDGFLDEVHRVLKPGGRFILTTPNADACLYRAHGERYCHNAEHVSLMSYTELRSLVDSRFEVIITKGFNGSYYRTFDTVADEAFAQQWTAAFEDRPDEGTGIILMCSPRPDYVARQAIEEDFHHTSPVLRYGGEWTRVSLHGPLTSARATRPECQVSLTWEGDGLILFLWSHPRSSRVRTTLDGSSAILDASSPVGGFLQQRWLGLSPGTHTLTLAPDLDPAQVGKGWDLRFWKAIGVRRAARAPRETARA